MEVLKKHVMDNTFSVDYLWGNLYSLSFVWDSNFVMVSWNSLLGEIISVTPDDGNIDFEELGMYIKNKLSEKY